METYTLWVCDDCLVLAANGERSESSCGCNDPHRPLSRVSGTVSPGLALSECGCSDWDTERHQECEQISFAWSSCDGCGCPLGGPRYALAEWPAPSCEALGG